MPKTPSSGDLRIVYRSPHELKPYPGNARTHSKRQVRQLKNSVKQFGFNVPALVDHHNGIIAGHARVEAAELLGLTKIPTIRIEHLSETEKRAFILADNKLCENAGWDNLKLGQELEFLSALDLDFELEITGFESAEIDILIESLDQGAADPIADNIPWPEDDTPPISRPGDLWTLRRHRLLCGDARDPQAFRMLMDGKPAQMVITDPPYNVAVNGNVCGLGRIQHPDFAMASGEMGEAEFTAFLERVFKNLVRFSVDGSIHFVFIDWRHMWEILTAGRNAYTELKNLCVWNKTNAGMGTFYRSKHELIFVFKNGTAPHINTFELGQHGRSRSNVWDYAGINSLRDGRLEDLAMHPTVKPVALVADAMLDCSKRNGIVLDAFAGSGTTIIAAERTGRKARTLEIDPSYVDTAIRRWQTFTGGEAVHAETGLPFADVAAARTTEEVEDA